MAIPACILKRIRICEDIGKEILELVILGVALFKLLHLSEPTCLASFCNLHRDYADVIIADPYGTMKSAKALSPQVALATHVNKELSSM